MSQHPRNRDLELDLSEQLEFLASSGAAFDRGALSESKRIAVAIRVLVHDTKMSHSLLDQLKIKDSLEWADGAPTIDKDPNIIGRSPGLTNMGLGPDGITFLARGADGIEQSSTTRYVSFDDWWNRTVLVDSQGAEFTRRDLVLELANKDGGAHIDRLKVDTHALIHSNSAGWVRGGGGDEEPIPTPIYASVRTIAEELLLTLRRSGYEVPKSTVDPSRGGIESFVAGDYTGRPLVVDESRDGTSRATFKFDTLPHVIFELTRLQQAQSDPDIDGILPAGWVNIVGRIDSNGEVVHQSGFAGPTDESTPPDHPDESTHLSGPPKTVPFTFDNFLQATFAACRSSEKQVVTDHYGYQRVREAGWIDLFVTLNGQTWNIGGFAGPSTA
ncbi:hypothetical protein ACFWQG_10495 [Rhodococcus sp. NPDC058532]|uniref:hypothetical protein n=1 Tax=Rhodococcus sp. NPDC058532 TaxID=3346540 RepID=UPI00364DAFF4